MTSLQLEQAIELIRANDYTSLVGITAVWYDYILTFSKETEYIWMKPWSWVSTLFVILVVRFAILGYFKPYSLPSMGVPFFLPLQRYFYILKSTKMMTIFVYWRCEISYFFCIWGFWVFMCSAEVMILRVWALYSLSRLVLGILLVFYAVEVVSYFVRSVLIGVSMSPAQTPPTAQISQLSFCSYTPADPHAYAWLLYLYLAAMLTLCASMSLLTIFRFMHGFRQVYKETGRFQPNRYLKHLAKDGVIYFLVILLFAVLAMLLGLGINTSQWVYLMGTTLENVPLVTLVPRFILSLRELYAQDVVMGSNIDTAFGLGLGVGGSALQSTIQFAEGQKDGDEIQMEEIRFRVGSCG